MSERESKLESTEFCPECQHSPTFIVEVEEWSDWSEQWDVVAQYWECPGCLHIWDEMVFSHIDPAEVM